MVRRKRYDDPIISYEPSSTLVNHLKERLRRGDSKEWQEVLKRHKITILDNVFQSMANLIYFLESIAVNPKLREDFEKDLIDLFDVDPPLELDEEKKRIKPHERKPLHPTFQGWARIDLKETTFTRLIYACLIPYEWKPTVFRLQLLYILQNIIYAKAKLVYENKYGVNDQITKSALKELENAIGWINGISKPLFHQKRKSRRIIDISNPYLSKRIF